MGGLDFSPMVVILLVVIVKDYLLPGMLRSLLGY